MSVTQFLSSITQVFINCDSYRFQGETLFTPTTELFSEILLFSNQFKQTLSLYLN